MKFRIKFTIFGKKFQTDVDCNSIYKESLRYNLLGKLSQHLEIVDVQELSPKLEPDLEGIKSLFGMK